MPNKKARLQTIVFCMELWSTMVQSTYKDNFDFLWKNYKKLKTVLVLVLSNICIAIHLFLHENSLFCLKCSRNGMLSKNWNNMLFHFSHWFHIFILLVIYTEDKYTIGQCWNLQIRLFVNFVFYEKNFELSLMIIMYVNACDCLSCFLIGAANKFSIVFVKLEILFYTEVVTVQVSCV